LYCGELPGKSRDITIIHYLLLLPAVIVATVGGEVLLMLLLGSVGGEIMLVTVEFINATIQLNTNSIT